MIRKILVGLDSTPYTDSAVRHAVKLSRTCGAELTGVALIHRSKLENVGPVPIGGNYYAKNLREFRVSETKRRIAEAVGKFEAACNAESVSFNVKHETGSPLKVMTSYARYHDLIVLGVRNSFEYGVIEESKDLLYQLIKAGVEPILACREAFHPIKRALIVYDGSIGSASSMKRFIQSGLWPDAEIRIVSLGEKSGKAKQLLDDAAAYVRGFGVSPETAFIKKDAKKGLLADATKWNADVIVMGNSTSNALIARLFPDVNAYMIKHAGRALFLAQS